MIPASSLARAQARVGTTLRGKYRLEAVLGVGGMAAVYRAMHRNRAEFAVKMLFSELSHDGETRARFLREGYAANSVKHPGVVLVVDDDVTEDGDAFLVMELLEGAPVEEMIERSGQSLPTEIVAAIAARLLDVLAAAHAAGIVHRDIKPANLFVTSSGGLKVLDFGIARVRDAAGLGIRATQSGVSFGTPAFMSPEQALGKTKDLDERTDIWSAGATMFTALTGRLVHEAATQEQVFIHAATKSARPIRSVMPSVPEPLAAVIDKALAFAPADRWSSAAAMRDAIRQAQRQIFRREAGADVLAAFCARLPPAASSVEPWPIADARSPANPARRHHSTTVPVEGHSILAQPSSIRRQIAVALAAGAATFAVAAIFLSHRARVPIPGAESSALPVVAESISASAPAPPPGLPPIEPAASVGATAAAASVSAETARAEPAPTAHVQRRASPAVAPRASGKTEVPNVPCAPPYTVDADGNKHFKAECFAP